MKFFKIMVFKYSNVHSDEYDTCFFSSHDFHIKENVVSVHTDHILKTSKS